MSTLQIRRHTTTPPAPARARTRSGPRTPASRELEPAIRDLANRKITFFSLAAPDTSTEVNNLRSIIRAQANSLGMTVDIYMDENRRLIVTRN